MCGGGEGGGAALQKGTHNIVPGQVNARQASSGLFFWGVSDLEKGTQSIVPGQVNARRASSGFFGIFFLGGGCRFTERRIALYLGRLMLDEHLDFLWFFGQI